MGYPRRKGRPQLRSLSRSRSRGRRSRKEEKRIRDKMKDARGREERGSEERRSPRGSREVETGGGLGQRMDQKERMGEGSNTQESDSGVRDRPKGGSEELYTVDRFGRMRPPGMMSISPMCMHWPLRDFCCARVPLAVTVDQILYTEGHTHTFTCTRIHIYTHLTPPPHLLSQHTHTHTHIRSSP